MNMNDQYEEHISSESEMTPERRSFGGDSPLRGRVVMAGIVGGFSGNYITQNLFVNSKTLINLFTNCW
jgi:hypothetical protein